MPRSFPGQGAVRARTRELGADQERAQAFAGLGQLALLEGAARDAVGLLEQAVETGGFDSVDHPAIAESLARAYASAGELSPAIALLQRCIDTYQASPDVPQALIEAAGTPAEVAHYRLERARALAALGRREDAASLAMVIAGQLADAQPLSRGRAYFLLAELWCDLGEIARARELYELAIECAEAQAPSKHLIAAYRGLAELLKLEGRRDEALDLLEQALNVQVASGIRG